MIWGYFIIKLKYKYHWKTNNNTIKINTNQWYLPISLNLGFHKSNKMTELQIY